MLSLVFSMSRLSPAHKYYAGDDWTKLFKMAATRPQKELVKLVVDKSKMAALSFWGYDEMPAV